ncbi:hypothetical protein Q4S45_07870 [Massilia sp. R2A-15]|uniref:hypothetical protein n=1 Tax=Massilia sp. R2A-15 TaxID=3064278 RepID=UPI0027365F20|nr:hypothetical protein [Massilia sp. R2A-15]WLI91024.1 hypothetical protein Q4S45_07870 [Massilia sp. R2A-15]
MKFSLPDSSGVIGDLVALKHGWTGAIREMSARANELSAANLHSAAWLDEQVTTPAANSWSLLDGAIRAFVAGSFLEAEPVDFGGVLPRDDGAWQSHFTFRKAA